MDRILGSVGIAGRDGLCVRRIIQHTGLFTNRGSNPTVGAQYRWTSLYAPRGFGSPAFWGLLQGKDQSFPTWSHPLMLSGWITVFTWIAVCAQPAFLLGTLIQGLLVLADADYPAEYQRWHGSLLAIACMMVPVVVNIFARKALAPLEVVGAITHVVFLIAWIVTLVTLAPRSSSEFVWTTNIFGLSGWNSHGVQWCVGLLSAVFPLGGFDGVLHMSRLNAFCSLA